jgi:hypothetical protein
MVDSEPTGSKIILTRSDNDEASGGLRSVFKKQKANREGPIMIVW